MRIGRAGRVIAGWNVSWPTTAGRPMAWAGQRSPTGPALPGAAPYGGFRSVGAPEICARLLRDGRAGPVLEAGAGRAAGCSPRLSGSAAGRRRSRYFRYFGGVFVTWVGGAGAAVRRGGLRGRSRHCRTRPVGQSAVRWPRTCGAGSGDGTPGCAVPGRRPGRGWTHRSLGRCRELKRDRLGSTTSRPSWLGRPAIMP